MSSGATCAPGLRQLYKWQDAGAAYEPCSPYPSVARFGDGTYKTLYVAESAAGAMAEYFRRHPELLDFQDDLVIGLYELDLNVTGDCLNVSDATGQASVGITSARLSSSDPDQDVRYVECRELAAASVALGLTGVIYPSAGAAWAVRNLVLFHDPEPGRWTCGGHRPTTRPHVTPSDVRPLLR